MLYERYDVISVSAGQFSDSRYVVIINRSVADWVASFSDWNGRIIWSSFELGRLTRMVWQP